MTQKTPAQLLTSFQNLDVPVQSDYEDVFDSYINVAQTTAQSIASDLAVRNFTADNISASSMTLTNGLRTAQVDTPLVSASAVRATTLDSGLVSAQRVNASVATFLNTVSAEQVFASAGNFGVLSRSPDTSVAATGGTQAGAKLLSSELNRVVSGSAGVRLTQIAGRGQMVWNDTNTNINVYPATGGQIDDLSTNSPYVVSASVGIGFYYFGSNIYLSK